MNTFRDGDWTVQALCANFDPDALFVQGAAQRKVRARCFSCPVRLECLADALNAQANIGVWGGLTERERRAMLRHYEDVTDWWDWLQNSSDELAVELRECRLQRVLSRVR